MFESMAPDLTGLDLPGFDVAGVMEPGSAGSQLPAVAVVAALAAVVPADVQSDHEVLDLVAAWDRVATWATARSIAATAEFARRPPDTRLGEPGAVRAPLGVVVRSHADDELAVRLGSSRRAVAWRIEAATALAVGLPRTGDAFATGRLDTAKTRVVLDECQMTSPDTVATVEAAVIDERAFAQPPARLRERARRAVIAADPASSAARSERAREERTICVTPLPDGMSELCAMLPAADAAAISEAVDAAARRLRSQPGETRGMDQLRADCLAAPFWNALRTGRLDGLDPVRLATRRGEPVAVQVTVPAAVLLGLSEQPGELAGHGPIPAPLARELARDGRWRRLLTDPVGRLVDVGRRTYRPTSAVQRVVELRDQRCRFPGCSAPAQRCDLDHVIPFPTGPTVPENLISLCRRHHVLKHGGRRDGDSEPAAEPGPGSAGRATPIGPVDGELTWRLPDGRRVPGEPPPIGDPAADRSLPATWFHGGSCKGEPPEAAAPP